MNLNESNVEEATAGDVEIIDEGELKHGII